MFWPDLDLRFKNDTEYGVLVQARMVEATPGTAGQDHGPDVVDEDLRQGRVLRAAAVELHLRTGDPGQQVRLRAAGAVEGFDVNYERLFYRDDEVVKTEKFFWRYKPTSQVICV